MGQTDDGNTTPNVTDVDPYAAFSAFLDSEDNPPTDPQNNQRDDDDDDDDVKGTGEPAKDGDADNPDADGDDTNAASDADDGDAASDDATDGDDATSTATTLSLKDYVFDVNGTEVDGEELQRGYMLQSDYTRKTQALADEKKAFEREIAAVREERGKYALLLDKLESRLKDVVETQAPDPELRRTNPAEYAAQKADWQDKQAALKRVQDEKDATLQKQQADAEAEFKTFVVDERKKLIREIPEWKDPAKASAGLNELAQYALSAGFTPDEINATVYHRAIIALRKAMLYDQLQQKRPVVRKKASGAPVLKPGATKHPKRKGSKAAQAREGLRKTGSVDAAASVFLAALEEGVDL